MSDGLSSVLSKTDGDEAKLTLPKVKFDYQFTTQYPGAQASGTHKAALSIDEKGAEVAAVSCMDVADGCMPSKTPLNFDFNRPFYFAMINHQNDEDPRIVGMALINQP